MDPNSALTISSAGEVDVAQADLAQAPLQHASQLGARSTSTSFLGQLVGLFLITVPVKQRAQGDIFVKMCV